MAKRWLMSLACGLAALGALQAGAGEAKATTIVALSPMSRSLILIDADKAKVIKTVRLKGAAALGTLRTIAFNPSDQSIYGMDDFFDLFRITPETGASKYTGNIGRFATPTTRMDCARIGTRDSCRFISQDGYFAAFDLPKGDNALVLPGLNGLLGKRVLGVAYAADLRLLLVEGLTDQLFLVSPPTSGTMVPIGRLGVDVEAPIAFDVLTTGKKAGGYMIAKRTLHKVNVKSGKTTKGKMIKNLTVDVTDMVVLED
ncbi:DUF4394 domain-containing protein [Chenggangzhangella methanolivorans]|uniref:DUF4394 domain-containing protein n=1 Tax=Chenggangzhangella methanolivorans TaxID=1437009 RepID=A0A9E6UIF2_9HYPH|nr:DUF4394 domain-containing protein [Chenggangzhangella methanolivorans]QZO00798.1 DUF4394 domain-containing protein [Chenggangzhangella methanolivorans]